MGGMALKGSTNSPAYAKTDSGTVTTEGASATNYNIMWDGETLTLNNATIAGAYDFTNNDEYHKEVAAIYRDGDLTIQLEDGQSTVNGPECTNKSGSADSYGIYVTGSLTIRGSGALEVNGSEQIHGLDRYGVNSVGIGVQGDITITDGSTVTAVGGDLTGERTYSYGISGSVIVSGGTVTATGGKANNYSYGINGINGYVTISGGEIIATGGEANHYSCGINGINGNVTISGGEIIATGGEANYYSYGIAGSTTVTGGTVTATGDTAGVYTTGTNSKVTVGAGLAVYVGNSKEDAAALSFTPNEDIKDDVDDKPYFLCKEAVDISIIGADDVDDEKGTVTKTYDGNSITLIAKHGSVTGVAYQWYKDGVLMAGKTDKTLELKDVADSGRYRVRITGDGDFTADSSTITVTINEGTIDITEDPDYSGIYDGQEHAVGVTTDPPGATVTYTYTVDGQTHDTDTTKPAFTDAGTYTVHYEVTMANYNTVTGDITVTITPATLTAAYVSETIYLGETPALAVEVTGFVPGESPDNAKDYVAPTVTTTETAVGSYVLTPTGGSARNYTFDYKEGTLTIRERPRSGGGSSSYRDREYNFWMDVRDEIRHADPGDTVKANARTYDRMPWSVMEALRDADGVTLHITWNGGEDIIIPSEAALSEQSRVYYPLSYLEGMTFEEESEAPAADPDKVNPETDGILEVTAPAVTTPAGEPEVTDSRRGLAETPGLAEEGIEQPLPGVYEPEETVTTSTTEESGTSGLWIAGVVAVLAAAGGGFWFWKQRESRS